MSVGILNDGTVKGVEMLSIGETAGLGMKADESDFKNQFKDKQVEKFSYTKTGEEGDDKIDAISGATITTNAVTNAVDSALVYFQNELGGGVKNKCMERIYNGVVKENPNLRPYAWNVSDSGSYDISNKWSRNGAFYDGSACYVKYADIYAA